MSLIVEVLKGAQRDAMAKGPPLPFIKYPYEEGLCLRALISKHVWLFRVAIGLSIVVILAVFVMTFKGTKSTPKVDASDEAITPPQEIPSAFPIDNFFQDKPTSEQKEKKITAPFTKGKKVRSKNQYSPSGKIFLQKRLPHDIRHRFDLALSYQKRGYKAKALEEYTKVTEMDPMNVEANNNLGVIYKDMGKLVQAAKQFQTVLSMNPHQEKARNNLGIIFYLQGNLEKAIQEFKGVLDINPRNKEAYINLGVMYKRRNRIGEAKRMFDNVLSIDPYHPEAHYNLGLIYEESGDIKEAKHHYQKFITLSGGAYRELAAKVKRHLETLYQAGS